MTCTSCYKLASAQQSNTKIKQGIILFSAGCCCFFILIVPSFTVENSIQKSLHPVIYTTAFLEQGLFLMREIEARV